MSSIFLRLPASSAYTNISLPTELNSAHKYLIVANSLAKELSFNHQDVHLKLSPKTQDIRPFLWNNFIAIKRYTYLVELSELTETYLQTIPEYKKWQHLQVVEEPLSDAYIKHHVQFLRNKVNSKRLRVIEKDLIQNRSLLNALSIKNEVGELLAQMLFNHQDKNAEQLFYMDESTFKRNRGGVFAQYAFMWYFKNKCYAQFDFCGANIKNIAHYKSRFPGKLHSFYELWHHQNKLKNFARKFLFHQI